MTFAARIPSKLRVAVLAPIAWRVPPRTYGPWEQFASLLTEGLTACDEALGEKRRELLLRAVGAVRVASHRGPRRTRCRRDAVCDRRFSDCGTPGLRRRTRLFGRPRGR